MSEAKRLETPLGADTVKGLRAGDEVLLSGVVYSARDQAHKLLCDSLGKGEDLPFDVEGAVIYYVGPTPADEGRAIGAAGPTTSSRMDGFSPMLYEAGLKGTIGKGYRGETVRRALKDFSAVHFSAVGGAAALLSRHIVECELIAYEQLGTEAVRRMRFVDFPAIVAYDCWGGSVYGNENDI